MIVNRLLRFRLSNSLILNEFFTWNMACVTVEHCHRPPSDWVVVRVGQ